MPAPTPTLKAALAMLQACGLQAVPIGRPDGPEMPVALNLPPPLLVSLAVDDSDEEKIARLFANAPPEAAQAEAVEQSRRSVEAAFSPARSTSAARDGPFGAGRQLAAGTLAGVDGGSFHEPAGH